MNLEAFGWLSLSGIENPFSWFEGFCFPTLELEDATQQNSHGFRTTFESMPTERLFLGGGGWLESQHLLIGMLN